LGYPPLADVTSSAIPTALGIGALCGVCGAFFGKALFWLVKQKGKIKGSMKLAAFALATGFCFALLALLVGKSTLGSGTEVVTGMLFSPTPISHSSWIAGRFLGSLLSYISGCAGGIFAPSLAAGGVIAAEAANFLSIPNPNLVILLGMIAFLTGVTRAPFTSFVLVLEMTDRHTVIFPMMLSAVAASAISKLVDSHSFYEEMKERYLHSLEKSSLKVS
jgi:H+/Cl- antiporter ClcA